MGSEMCIRDRTRHDERLCHEPRAGYGAHVGYCRGILVLGEILTWPVITDFVGLGRKYQKNSERGFYRANVRFGDSVSALSR